MSEYKVEIRETLSRTVSVMADSEDGALVIIKDMYKNSHIVLDSGDFTDVDFKISER